MFLSRLSRARPNGHVVLSQGALTVAGWLKRLIGLDRSPKSAPPPTMRGPTSPAIPPYYPVPEFDWRLKQPQRPPAPFFPPQARKEPKGVDEPDYLPVRRRRFPRRTRNARTTAVYNPEQLSRYNLPLIETADDLAARLGTSPGALTWLTWPEDAPSHYVSREIPKRSGGSRLICAPKPRTRAAQDWIMRHILRRLPVHDCAHGFVRGRSILTNAQAHVGKHIVVNLDLEDFFPRNRSNIIFPTIIICRHGYGRIRNFSFIS